MNTYFNVRDLGINDISKEGDEITIDIRSSLLQPIDELKIYARATIIIKEKHLLNFSKIDDALIKSLGIAFSGNISRAKKEWKILVAEYLYEQPIGEHPLI